MFCREFNSEYQLCYYYDDVTVMLFINIKYDDVAVPVKASGNEQRYVIHGTVDQLGQEVLTYPPYSPDSGPQ